MLDTRSSCAVCRRGAKYLFGPQSMCGTTQMNLRGTLPVFLN